MRFKTDSFLLFNFIVALSQIMTRMGLDFLGRPSNDVPRHGFWSTRGMINLVLGFWAGLNVVVLIGIGVKASAGVAVSGPDVAALILVNISLVVYVVLAAATTRRSIRDQYLIPAERFGALADVILSTFCLPVTLAQMGRHTASYDNHVAVFCNDTGLAVDDTIDHSFGGINECRV